MSEYQFYEFKTIDKPLSEKDKIEISNWSSRTNASNTGAIFTYSYGDFPKNVLKVVEKYFDAMFYMANWGTTQLVFRLPNNLICSDQLRQYCITDGIDLIIKPDFTLVNICISYEEGSDRWIEGEGWLASLASLRQDILSWDYRCLYLIWLKVITEDAFNQWSNIDLNIPEPKVPGQLKSLNGALRDFIDIFEIDEDAITVASAKSRSSSPGNTEDYSSYIDRLSHEEKDAFLLRLLENEPLLNVSLKKRLKNFVPQDGDDNSEKPRTVGEISQAIKELKERKRIEDSRKREEIRLTRLKKIEQQESHLWDTVELLIKEKKTKSYEEAIKLLQDLKELSVHKNQFDAFCKKIENIKQRYTRLPGLQSRIIASNLTEK